MSLTEVLQGQAQSLLPKTTTTPTPTPTAPAPTVIQLGGTTFTKSSTGTITPISPIVTKTTPLPTGTTVTKLTPTGTTSTVVTTPTLVSKVTYPTPTPTPPPTTLTTQQQTFISNLSKVSPTLATAVQTKLQSTPIVQPTVVKLTPLPPPPTNLTTQQQSFINTLSKVSPNLATTVQTKLVASNVQPVTVAKPPVTFPTNQQLFLQQLGIGTAPKTPTSAFSGPTLVSPPPAPPTIPKTVFGTNMFGFPTFTPVPKTVPTPIPTPTPTTTGGNVPLSVKDMWGVKTPSTGTESIKDFWGVKRTPVYQREGTLPPLGSQFTVPINNLESFMKTEGGKFTPGLTYELPNFSKNDAGQIVVDGTTTFEGSDTLNVNDWLSKYNVYTGKSPDSSKIAWDTVFGMGTGGVTSIGTGTGKSLLSIKEGWLNRSPTLNVPSGTFVSGGTGTTVGQVLRGSEGYKVLDRNSGIQAAYFDRYNDAKNIDGTYSTYIRDLETFIPTIKDTEVYTYEDGTTILGSDLRKKSEQDLKNLRTDQGTVQNYINDYWQQGREAQDEWHPQTTIIEYDPSKYHVNKTDGKVVAGAESDYTEGEPSRYAPQFPYGGADKYYSYYDSLQRGGIGGLFATSLTGEDPLGLASAYYTATGDKQKAIDVKIKALAGVDAINEAFKSDPVQGAWQGFNWYMNMPTTQIVVAGLMGGALGKTTGYISRALPRAIGIGAKTAMAVGGGAMMVPQAQQMIGQYQRGEYGELLGESAVLGLSLYGGAKEFATGYNRGVVLGDRSLMLQVAKDDASRALLKSSFRQADLLARAKTGEPLVAEKIVGLKVQDPKTGQWITKTDYVPKAGEIPVLDYTQAEADALQLALTKLQGKYGLENTGSVAQYIGSQGRTRFGKDWDVLLETRRVGTKYAKGEYPENIGIVGKLKTQIGEGLGLKTKSRIEEFKAEAAEIINKSLKASEGEKYEPWLTKAQIELMNDTHQPLPKNYKIFESMMDIHDKPKVGALLRDYEYMGTKQKPIESGIFKRVTSLSEQAMRKGENIVDPLHIGRGKDWADYIDILKVVQEENPSFGGLRGAWRGTSRLGKDFGKGITELEKWKPDLEGGTRFPVFRDTTRAKNIMWKTGPEGEFPSGVARPGTSFYEQNIELAPKTSRTWWQEQLWKRQTKGPTRAWQQPDIGSGTAHPEMAFADIQTELNPLAGKYLSNRFQAGVDRFKVWTGKTARQFYADINPREGVIVPKDDVVPMWRTMTRKYLAGDKSDFSGKTGELEFHHTNYKTNEGFTLTKDEHALFHSIDNTVKKGGDVPVSQRDFYNRFKPVNEMTDANRAIGLKQFLSEHPELVGKGGFKGATTIEPKPAIQKLGTALSDVKSNFESVVRKKVTVPPEQITVTKGKAIDMWKTMTDKYLTGEESAYSGAKTTLEFHHTNYKTNEGFTLTKAEHDIFHQIENKVKAGKTLEYWEQQYYNKFKPVNALTLDNRIAGVKYFLGQNPSLIGGSDFSGASGPTAPTPSTPVAPAKSVIDDFWGVGKKAFATRTDRKLSRALSGLSDEELGKITYPPDYYSSLGGFGKTYKTTTRGTYKLGEIIEYKGKRVSIDDENMLGLLNRLDAKESLTGKELKSLTRYFDSQKEVTTWNQMSSDARAYVRSTLKRAIEHEIKMRPELEGKYNVDDVVAAKIENPDAYPEFASTSLFRSMVVKGDVASIDIPTTPLTEGGYYTKYPVTPKRGYDYMSYDVEPKIGYNTPIIEETYPKIGYQRPNLSDSRYIKSIVDKTQYPSSGYSREKYPTKTQYPTVPETVYPEYPRETYPSKPTYPERPTYPEKTYPEYPEKTYPEYPEKTYPKYPEDTYPKYPEDTYPEYPKPSYPEDTYPKYPKETYPKTPYPEEPYPEYPKPTYPKPPYPEYPTPPEYPDYPYPKPPYVPPPTYPDYPYPNKYPDYPYPTEPEPTPRPIPPGGILPLDGGGGGGSAGGGKGYGMGYFEREYETPTFMKSTGLLWGGKKVSLGRAIGGRTSFGTRRIASAYLPDDVPAMGITSKKLWGEDIASWETRPSFERTPTQKLSVKPSTSRPTFIRLVR